MRALWSILAASAAACGDPPNCEKAAALVSKWYDGAPVAPLIEQCQREHWSGEMRDCIKSASSRESLDRCRRYRQGPLEYMKKSKTTPGELGLKRLESALETAWNERAAFPSGHAGPTPEAGSCCNHVADRKCPPDPSLWQDPIWEALDFTIDEPGYYWFEYESDGKTATARAIGDLDCDGEPSAYILHCTSDGGAPRCELTKPDRPD